MNIEDLKLEVTCLEPSNINGIAKWIMHIRLDAQKNEITRISIYDVEKENFLIQNLPARVSEMTFAQTTYDGLEVNDPLNVWKTDYSQISLRLNRDAMGRFGIITLWLKQQDTTFVLMVSKTIK
jgi:hypothetical protein